MGLGVLLQVMQQLTGMNVVMYYAPRIFEGMGYATEAQMWFTAIVGLTNVLATFIAIGLVDRLAASRFSTSASSSWRLAWAWSAR